jgi:hypothetical protein
MSVVDRELCRRRAAEFVELARVTTDPEVKRTLLTRAQEWLKLAYSETDEEFRDLVAGFNSHQMHGGPPVQRQPMQQQQSKTEDDK